MDEWLAQVDVTTTTDRPAWVLQDANYNVLALVDSQSRVLRLRDSMGRRIGGVSLISDTLQRYSSGLNVLRAAVVSQWAQQDSAQAPDFPKKADRDGLGGTSGGTPPPVSPSKGAIDQDLNKVVSAWPTLPSAIRTGVLAMIDSVKGGA